MLIKIQAPLYAAGDATANIPDIIRCTECPRNVVLWDSTNTCLCGAQYDEEGVMKFLNETPLDFPTSHR